MAVNEQARTQGLSSSSTRTAPSSRTSPTTSIRAGSGSRRELGRRSGCWARPTRRSSSDEPVGRRARLFHRGRSARRRRAISARSLRAWRSPRRVLLLSACRARRWRQRVCRHLRLPKTGTGSRDSGVPRPRAVARGAWFVGDTWMDVVAGRRAGCRTIMSGPRRGPRTGWNRSGAPTSRARQPVPGAQIILAYHAGVRSV